MRNSTLVGLCLFLALPAWGQRAGGFGGGMGMGRGAGFGHGGVRNGAVIGFGTPGAFAGFGSPFGFGAGFGSPFGFGFGTGVFANVRSPFVLGFGTPQTFVNAGIPPLGGLPSLGLNAPPGAFFTGNLAADTFPGWSLPFYPFAYGGYGGGYDMMPPASPNIIVLQPMTPEMMGMRQKPPEPAKLEVREVSMPAAAAQPYPPEPLAPQQMFSLAFKNGATDSAMAAWVQDDCLYYLNPGGKRVQVAVAAVDRATTRRLNREKNLSLWLPPE